MVSHWSLSSASTAVAGRNRDAALRNSKPGKPVEVSIHDFPDKEPGTAVPYGVYDLANNEAGVTVGISHDTAEFAVAAISRWWASVTHPQKGC